MASTPYSFTLNLIRQGFDMAESWFELVSRFPEAKPNYLNLDWAKAWSGRGAAGLMGENEGMTFGQVLNLVPGEALVGGRTYNFTQLAQNLSELVSGPYDLQLIIQATKGPSKFFGTERWELQVNDTYVSITNRIKDALVREYALTDDGSLRFVTSYVIGV